MAQVLPKIDYNIIQDRKNELYKSELSKFKYAVSNYGFLLLKNTPITKGIKKNIFKTYREFFKLPHVYKNKVNMANTLSNRGWGAPLVEQVNKNYNPDYKEIFDCGTEKDQNVSFSELTYYSKNLWPEELPNFKKEITGYFEICTEIAMNLLSFIEVSLEISNNFFRDKFENPMSLLRCNYYPPRKSNLSNKDYGVAPHTDYGCLTLLVTDDNPGLEIKNPFNKWELVIPEPEDIVVNFGDMIEMWSKNKIKATSHKVFGNRKERFSIPFFFNPQFDTIISEENGIVAGEYLSSIYNSTYLHKNNEQLIN